MASQIQTDDAFSQNVHHLRAEYEQCRLATNLFPPGGKPVLELDLQCGDKSSMTFWYDDGTEHGQCVRIFDVPGTLSGDILRIRRNLPAMSAYPEVIDDDSEDVSELVSKLPLVSVDPAKHFVKKGKYRSEVENLIKCQGGSVPGHPFSPNIIQLLGRSSDGQLVFEKLWSSARTLGHFSSLALYKSWILQLIDALHCLHSVGIIHRDLRTDNLLFSNDGQRLVVCDLESRWGERKAPEVAFKGA
ncbi:Protein kinase-like domain protein [Cordyceps fumosorosea ARSEF 2679]|uniref:EKC/KEOPS complex subunit BUD32 n=1 Tax=Cordyceps fumosorosea (strain ARSEF 2679) TaxID=1081104 RepID=A0A167TPF0_CORFA|nr:Protein kinase-like domain protein [Cordyceps fumosorosea ARSEF 2679]OAA60810.1 Protein kinase-like domain protein [Cordyceps fumosorosea ARSEF 2679]